MTDIFRFEHNPGFNFAKVLSYSRLPYRRQCIHRNDFFVLNSHDDGRKPNTKNCWGVPWRVSLFFFVAANHAGVYADYLLDLYSVWVFHVPDYAMETPCLMLVAEGVVIDFASFMIPLIDILGSSHEVRLALRARAYFLKDLLDVHTHLNQGTQSDDLIFQTYMDHSYPHEPVKLLAVTPEGFSIMHDLDNVVCFTWAYFSEIQSFYHVFFLSGQKVPVS